MNISRMTIVRPVAIAAIAAGLVGCTAVLPAEPSATTSVQTAQTESAAQAEAAVDAGGPGVRVDQAAEPDDDEEVVDPSGDVGTDADNWAESVPKRPPRVDTSARPPAPSPLVDYLPATSPLWGSTSKVTEEFVEALATMDPNAATAIALTTLLAAGDLVNSGALEPFATSVSWSCQYCLQRLDIAHRVQVDDDLSADPWVIQFAPEARVGEVSGPDHLIVEVTAENTGLVYGRANQLSIAGMPGPTIFGIEMLFDQGQWWVVGVSTRPV